MQITISRETHDKLRRAQDLLRHVVLDSDPAAVFDRALTLLVEDLGKEKMATAKRASGRQADTEFASRAGRGQEGSLDA